MTSSLLLVAIMIRMKSVEMSSMNVCTECRPDTKGRAGLDSCRDNNNVLHTIIIMIYIYIYIYIYI